jgi:hypothetical protein
MFECSDIQNSTKMKKSSNIGLRWAARITGTLMVVFTLIFAIGELFEHPSKQGPGLDSYTKVVFTVWGIGLAGLVLALWKEGLGGKISLLCFIVFNILVATNPNPEYRYSVVLLFFLIPSILYLRWWWLDKKSMDKVLTG